MEDWLDSLNIFTMRKEIGARFIGMERGKEGI